MKTLLRLGTQHESEAAVDEALSKRLQGCRGARGVNGAAKALILARRLLAEGHPLADVSGRLAAVCSEQKGRTSTSTYVAAVAVYFRALSGYEYAAQLHKAGQPAAAREWLAMAPASVLPALKRVQLITARALECAQLSSGPSPSGSLVALRMYVLEDALCLYRMQADGVAMLQTSLLKLPAGLIGGGSDDRSADGGAYTALGALDVFGLHTRKALALQTQLVDEAYALPPTPGLVPLLEARIPWPAALELPTMPDPGLHHASRGRRNNRASERITDASEESSTTDNESEAPAASLKDMTASGAQPPSTEANASSHPKATVALDAEADEYGEVDLLLRAVLESLLGRSLAALSEKFCGRTVETATDLSADECRRIGATEAVHAARLQRHRKPNTDGAISAPAAGRLGESSKGGGREAGSGGLEDEESRHGIHASFVRETKK